MIIQILQTHITAKFPGDWRQIMKIITVVIMILIIANSNILLAREYTIKDNKGNNIGYLKKSGNRTYFIDNKGRRGDYIESDGTIKNNRGAVQGYLKQDGNKTYLTSPTWKRGDYIDKDGNIKDPYGRIKGTVKHN